MISLAGRDILHGWGKFVFTGVGLGLLLGLRWSWPVSTGGWWMTAWPCWTAVVRTCGWYSAIRWAYAESSSINDDLYRGIRAMPGVAQAANITYLTMQVRKGQQDVRSMVVGVASGQVGGCSRMAVTYLTAGRQMTRGHYEAVADLATGFKIGDQLDIRRNRYTVVGLTRRMVHQAVIPWSLSRSRMPRRPSS